MKKENNEVGLKSLASSWEKIRLAKMLSKKYGRIDKVPPRILKGRHLSRKKISAAVLNVFGGKESVSQEVLDKYEYTMNMVIGTLAQRLGIKGLAGPPYFRQSLAEKEKEAREKKKKKP